jgi:DNA-binding MarR family transcriptional regulator
MSQPDTDQGAGLRVALGTDLGWLLGQTLRSYMRMADEAGKDIPGGMRGYQVLTVASNGCMSTQLGIARELGLDRTVMTHLVDDLEGAGLIQRTAVPGDRRAKQVTVTDAGRERYAQVRDLLIRAEDHLLRELSQDERHSLRSLLRQVAGHKDITVAGMCEVAEDLRRDC